MPRRLALHRQAARLERIFMAAQPQFERLALAISNTAKAQDTARLLQDAHDWVPQDEAEAHAMRAPSVVVADRVAARRAARAPGRVCATSPTR